MINTNTPAFGWMLTCDQHVREADRRLQSARQGRQLANDRARASHRQMLQSTVDVAFLHEENAGLREENAWLIDQVSRLQAQLAART